MTPPEDGSPPGDRQLLADVAGDAAIEAPGVVAVCDVVAAPGRAGPELRPRARLRLSVIAEYGVRLPAMAAVLRERVAAAVEERTGWQVSAVDVTVADLHIPGEPLAGRAPAAEGAAGARLDF